MQTAETEPTTRIAAEPEDIEVLAGIMATPLSRIAPDRAKAVAGRAKELHRRQTAVTVASFNSGL